jgi:hypothetical protein
MDLSYFNLHSVNFEVRYDMACLLWDRAGSIWHVMRKNYPTLKFKEVVPAKVRATVDDKYQLAVEIDKLSASVFLSVGSLGDYMELCQQLLSGAVKALELTAFSRIGLRLVHRRDFQSVKEASEVLISTNMMKVPQGKHFGIEGHPTLPHYAMRWEGDTLGVQVNFRTQERKVTVEPIMGEPTVQRIDKELFELIFDVDYYTIGSVDVGQFRVSDWMSNAMRVIRRDSKVFLGA